MSNLISTAQGWKPHVVYEFIGVRRQTLMYWRDNIYPLNEKKLFSTYDILLYEIIKTYIKQYGVQSTKLKGVDWQAIYDELVKLSFTGHKNKVLNIDLNDNSYKIYDSFDDLRNNSGHKIYIDIEQLSNLLMNKMINYGNDQSVAENTDK